MEPQATHQIYTITAQPLWPEVIYQFRQDLGMTQQQFGDLFGVSRIAVHYWETGKREAPYTVTWPAFLYMSGGNEWKKTHKL